MAGDVLRSVAANIRSLRRRRGLTQAALAEKARLDLRQIQRAESGRVDIGIVAVAAVAEALEVLPGRLFRHAPFSPQPPGRPSQKRPKG
jgi:transcriptional regulator with XRE-family HTH domain